VSFQRPKFSPEALAPHEHDRRSLPAVELAPGLARAPRVAKLLNNAYDIAHRELAALNERHFQKMMGPEDWTRFGMLLKNLPALMREERAGDEQRMRLLGQLPEATLKLMVAEYYGLEEKRDEAGTESPEAPQALGTGPHGQEDGQAVEDGPDPNDVGGDPPGAGGL